MNQDPAAEQAPSFPPMRDVSRGRGGDWAETGFRWLRLFYFGVAHRRMDPGNGGIGPRLDVLHRGSKCGGACSFLGF